MKQNKGFTLIELLIVLLVIGLISSFAFPKYTSIQNKAKITNAKALGHSLQIALESYFVDKGSYPAGTALSASNLIETLYTNGDFGSTPKNPFTGSTYSEKDTAGKITYTYNATTQVYTITLYDSDNKTVIDTITNS